jgi:hypothetical protein
LRPSAKAILAASVPTGTMLFVAAVILGRWYDKYLLETSGYVPGVAIGHLPPPNQFDELIDHLFDFVWLCFLGAIWTAVVVVPAILVARHFLSGRWSSRLVSFGFLCAVSALFFAFRWAAGPWSQSLIFGIGGCIGLVCAAIAEMQMPPNTSLERTREG